MIGKLLGVAVAGVAAYAAGRALAETQRSWTVSYSRDGYRLELTETPLWAILAEETLEALPCTCSMPEWAYRVGLKRFGVHDDGSGVPLHSLGSAGYSLCQARHSLVFKTEKRVGSMPLDRDTAQEYAPEWVAECDVIFCD